MECSVRVQRDRELEHLNAQLDAVDRGLLSLAETDPLTGVGN